MYWRIVQALGVKMSDELYIVAIAALLPLTATMLVTQVNPYHALVIRGILGAVAALVYALFGAADVALTEALVGTMLSITLYAIAVRSSMSLRLGVSESIYEANQTDVTQELLPVLRQALRRHHMRLEIVCYHNSQALRAALESKEIHGVLTSQKVTAEEDLSLHGENHATLQHLTVRVQRLYSILQAGVPKDVVTVEYCQSVPSALSAQASVSAPVQNA